MFKIQCVCVSQKENEREPVFVHESLCEYIGIQWSSFRCFPLGKNGQVYKLSLGVYVCVCVS